MLIGHKSRQSAMSDLGMVKTDVIAMHIMEMKLNARRTRKLSIHLHQAQQTRYAAQNFDGGRLEGT